MTQIATVEKILDSQHAIISVPRKSACGHDCEECAGCGISGTAIRAKAINTVGARVGEKVVVESSTEKMLGIVALVYVTPIVLFFVGYITMLLLNFSVAVQYSVAGLGFVLGILSAVWYDRRLRDRGGLSFTIVRLF
jgi:sigma-E factor negative regulatory protein RseC